MLGPEDARCWARPAARSDHLRFLSVLVFSQIVHGGPFLPEVTLLKVSNPGAQDNFKVALDDEMPAVNPPPSPPPSVPPSPLPPPVPFVPRPQAPAACPSMCAERDPESKCYVSVGLQPCEHPHLLSLEYLVTSRVFWQAHIAGVCVSNGHAEVPSTGCLHVTAP